MAEGGGAVEVTVSVGDGVEGVEGAVSLYRWLVDEPELRGQAGVSLEAEPSEPGQMGGGLELVNVVLSNSIALGSLVTAVATWRGSRPRPPQIRLERDGVVVTLQDGSPEAVEQILRVWSAGESDQGDEGGAPGSGARGGERG